MDRETKAKEVCMTCFARLQCLETALVWHEDHGVWGGMGEGERRRFQTWLKSEGYGDEIPTGAELAASLRQFYIYEKSQATMPYYK